MKKWKNQSGVIDPLSLGVLAFLLVSFIVGATAVIRNSSFDIRERANTYCVGQDQCLSNFNSCCSGLIGVEYPACGTIPIRCQATCTCPEGCIAQNSGTVTCVPYCNKACTPDKECVPDPHGGNCVKKPDEGELSTPGCLGKCVSDYAICSPVDVELGYEDCPADPPYRCVKSDAVCSVPEIGICPERCVKEGRGCEGNTSTCKIYCKPECNGRCESLDENGGICEQVQEVKKYACNQNSGLCEEIAVNSTETVFEDLDFCAANCKPQCDFIGYRCQNSAGVDRSLFCSSIGATATTEDCTYGCNSQDQCNPQPQNIGESCTQDPDCYTNNCENLMCQPGSCNLRCKNDEVCVRLDEGEFCKKKKDVQDQSLKRVNSEEAKIEKVTTQTTLVKPGLCRFTQFLRWLSWWRAVCLFTQ